MVPYRDGQQNVIMTRVQRHAKSPCGKIRANALASQLSPESRDAVVNRQCSEMRTATTAQRGGQCQRVVRSAGNYAVISSTYRTTGLPIGASPIWGSLFSSIGMAAPEPLTSQPCTDRAMRPSAIRGMQRTPR